MRAGTAKWLLKLRGSTLHVDEKGKKTISVILFLDVKWTFTWAGATSWLGGHSPLYHKNTQQAVQRQQKALKFLEDKRETPHVTTNEEPTWWSKDGEAAYS